MILKINQQKLVFAWGVVLLVMRTTNLLSLFVEWVKLFPDNITGGKNSAFGRHWQKTIFGQSDIEWYHLTSDCLSCIDHVL